MELSLEDLQQQFKQIQQKESSHKLSERNCVEILMKLLDLKMIELIYTLDGKEYLTHKQLEREIRDELLLHRGRINILELVPIINIDQHRIEQKLKEMLKKDRSIRLVDGELISNYYLDGIAQEINETLQALNKLSISDLSSRFGLSTDMIRSIIEKNVGANIQGLLDGDYLYTNAYISRVKSQVRGTFSAITRPTNVNKIFSKIQLDPDMIFGILDDLIQEERLKGTVQGRRDKATYIPAIFSHARQDWVVSFFSQNQFIEYEKLERLLFSNPRNYLESQFPEGIPLQTCFASKSILSQVDGTIAEIMENQGWVDITTFIPPSFTNEDIFQLLQASPVAKKCLKSQEISLFADLYLVSKSALDKCLEKYEQHVKDLSQKGLLPKITVDDQKEVSEGKRGKGGKGKKPKKVKEQSKPLVEESEIVPLLRKWIADAPDDLLEAIAAHLSSHFAEIKEKASRAAFVETTDTKKLGKTNEQDLQTIYWNIELFRKGIETLPEEQQVLEKHLLKTLCTEMVNLLITNEAMHNQMDIPALNNPSQRNQVISKFSPEVAKPLERLHATLTGKSVQDYLDQLEPVTKATQIKIKPLDKKNEKQLLMNHRLALMDQLTKESNVATAFHLVVVILYLKKNSVMLHVPGRSISAIFKKLEGDIPHDDYQFLSEYQSKVIKVLTEKNNELEKELEEMLPKLKEIALGKDEIKEEQQCFF